MIMLPMLRSSKLKDNKMRTKEEQERNKQNPIYGTDFSKPISVLLQDVRNDLVRLRGRLGDIERGSVHEERIQYISGLLTGGVVSLGVELEKISKIEIVLDDYKFGQSYHFASRGIGIAWISCFVCGGKPDMKSNLASFVNSKEDGEIITSWFSHGAVLDFREHEPNWIQVKIGACQGHLEALKKLEEKTLIHKVIREADVVSILDSE